MLITNKLNNMKNNFKLLYVLLLVFITSCSTDNDETTDDLIKGKTDLLDKKLDQAEVIPGEYIIVYKKDATTSKMSYTATRRGLTPELKKVQDYYKERSIATLNIHPGSAIVEFS